MCEIYKIVFFFPFFLLLYVFIAQDPKYYALDIMKVQVYWSISFSNTFCIFRKDKILRKTEEKNQYES